MTWNNNKKKKTWSLKLAAQDAGMTATTTATTITIVSPQAQQNSQSKIAKAASNNNREEDADEGDRVQTDGHYVYGAYGDTVVIWDRKTGTIVTQEQMKDTNKKTEEPQKDDDDDDDAENFAYLGFEYDQPLYIDALQLTEHHVLVMVGGFGGNRNYYQDPVTSDAQGATQLCVFLKPTPESPSLTRVSTMDLNGHFVGSHLLEDTDSIHITTAMDSNSYGMFVSPLELYNFPPEVRQSRALYLEAATKLATDELIPNFVSQMADLLMDHQDDETVDQHKVLQINNWVINDNGDAEPGSASSMATFGISDEAIRAIVRVTSLRVQDLPLTPSPETEVPVTTASFLGPSSYTHAYATQDSLVLNLNKYEWNEEEQASKENLFLIHLKVDPADASTAFHSIGHLVGHLPNQHSIDIQGNDLRVATTHQKWNPLDQVWPVCGEDWQFTDSCINEQNWNDCFDITIDGCSNVVMTGCPYVYSCGDDEIDTEAVDDARISSTENFIVVLDISDTGDMAEIGRASIGEPHEVITAVKFGETFTYAMTFDLVS